MSKFDKFRGPPCRSCDGLGFQLSNKLGPALKVMRLRKGIEQRDMAKRLGIRADELCRIEAGKRRIKARVVKRYRMVLRLVA